MMMLVLSTFNPLFGQTSNDIMGEPVNASGNEVNQTEEAAPALLPAPREYRTVEPEKDEKDDFHKFFHKERRIDRSFQIQFVQAFASANPYEMAPGAGLHIGYQMSESWYLGLTSIAYYEGRNMFEDRNQYRYDDDKYSDEFDKVYGQDKVEKSDSTLEPVHLLETRFTPWEFGLYFSFGVMYRGKQSSTTTFKEDSREIGDNTYTTGLEAKVDYKEWYAPSMGIGFSYIFNNGLVLGTALTNGLNRQTPDVEVSATAVVAQDDLDYWKKQIEYNERQIPSVFSLSIGYAF